MRPITRGDTGRGVEDIQRRLMRLDYDLSTYGADGDFHTETEAAVRAFQKSCDLPVTGEVDMRTWSMLVDSTFVFGDRSLYLRRPHFHGQDVRTLQCALGALGFCGGRIDGIFGSCTERAVIEFQRNMEISPDGAVGQLTYEALNGLRHIWDNRQVHAHSMATAAPTLNREAPLMKHAWCFVATDGPTQQIVRRLVNLASASAPDADISYVVARNEVCQSPQEAVCVVLAAQDNATGYAKVCVPYTSSRPAMAATLREALSKGDDSTKHFVIAMQPESLIAANQLQYQFVAAVVLDTLCVVFE